jgi:hypothetical protein
MVLTMVYNTQNQRVFGFRPSSGILKTKEHNVSETGSDCSVFTPHIALAAGNKGFTNSPLHPMHWFSWNWFVAKFVAYNFHLLFCLSFRSVHALSLFLLHTFLLSPLDITWSQLFTSTQFLGAG